MHYQPDRLRPVLLQYAQPSSERSLPKAMWSLPLCSLSPGDSRTRAEPRHMCDERTATVLMEMTVLRIQGGRR